MLKEVIKELIGATLWLGSIMALFVLVASAIVEVLPV